ncbi:hypothetical protein SERLA73DRAFT_101203 [Serpula lacrymans var. lacrymans S7.3]|uniref:DUF726-domain-containing protein n=2 Tax=Serpula lacrymans var. lacrymans TaxID=341189 RepID=F8PGF3_SERL3|nr:uncharacterized protein SERLADRAFT_432885 [Serpula lacrymans var. lacrymans S7.9]EGO05386.1 hypothetical protein SERLA73DRAFT_101203 [Serpula lacrymans var. lacrymans S7.3]EGO31238.1 hypothetical protein SERLADRAFT_432885 [Serpula lacrymans var. lacrymans S7.9]
MSKAPQDNPFLFDDDEEGWQEMPVVKEDDFANGLDEEDQKKYHYVHAAKKTAGGTGNATGNLIDFDDEGVEWRSKVDQNENEYTRLRVQEEDEADEVHLRTRYLFDEDKAMTPLSQMQATKNMLTESQRIAYVGLCALTSREMAQCLKAAKRKELKASIQSMELWAMKIMGRLYYHMELETAEQQMIQSLGEHGVEAMDLAPSLMTTHTVANPEYDPVEARRQADVQREQTPSPNHKNHSIIKSDSHRLRRSLSPKPPSTPTSATQKTFHTTARVLEDTSVASSAMPGVTTSLSTTDKDVTLDIRWTVLCDLFLILIADSVYDARSRVLLESVALKLGLGWLDVVKFESRVTEALEIQEGVEKMENQEIIDGAQKAARKRRYMMMGLATLGGGLVIGLSAGLLAPVIGAGLGAAFTTIGIGGTTGFLAGAGGAAVITTGGVLTGSGIAVRGMARRTRQVRTFNVLPLHNNKRVSCILTVPGFMNGKLDDVRLPFSVLDPIVGDVFSVLWEPEMIQETGSALKILTGEILSQIGQTVLQHTVMTALMGALQWPIILTKLGYLIDNPWSNALDRARAAGSVLAELLAQRHLGVRPITLIGFSLGARVIFYALQDLAKQKAFGIVQDVFLLGATLTAPTSSWCDARAVVSGRFVNGFARNDWVLNYLFRATSGGLNTVAGLRPIENVPGLENVDVTDKIAGHMSYRSFMPLILDELGFPVSSSYFDEPVEPDFTEDRIVVKEEDQQAQKKSWFSRKKKKVSLPSTSISRPPSSTPTSHSRHKAMSSEKITDDDLPPREHARTPVSPNAEGATVPEPNQPRSTSPDIPAHAGFDFSAIKNIIGQAEHHPDELRVPPQPNRIHTPQTLPGRSESAPLHAQPEDSSRSATPVVGLSTDLPSDEPADLTSASTLSTGFARSLSLRDVNSGYSGPMTSYQHQGAELTTKDNISDTSPLTPSYPTSYTTPQSSLTPELSFGRSDGSIWSASPSRQEPNNTAFGNPFASSTDTLSFGSTKNGSITTFGNYMSSAPQSSFALPYSAAPSNSLSFGGADGSITLSGAEQDPWSTPVESKKTSSYHSNPWSN